FQVKSLTQTINGTLFEIPSGRDQCRNIHLSWVNNPKTPYLCQIHEYIQETKSGEVPPGELPQRKAMTRILEGKLNLIQRDYVSNLCQNLDNEEAFCDEFLNVSFWSKISGGLADKIYAEDIC